MPIDISLDESNNFMDSRYYDHVSFDDIQTVNDRSVQILDESSREKLHLIMDVKDVKSHPNNVAKIWNISSKTTNHKKLGTTIVVGMDNPITKFLIEMIATFGKTSLKAVSTREEALEILSTIE